MAAITAGVLLAAGQAAFAASSSGPYSSTLANGTLNTKIWTQVIGQDSQMSMTKNPGWMTIGTEYAPNAAFAAHLHNMVLQPVSSSANWTVSVEESFFGATLTSITAPNFVQAGIYAWVSPTSWLRIIRQPAGCQLQVSWLSSGTVAQPTVATTNGTVACDSQDDPLWLRLTKSGDTYTGYYSTNGTTWVETNSETMPSTFAPVDIGLNADQGGSQAPPTYIGFKDFTVLGQTGASPSATTSSATSSSSSSTAPSSTSSSTASSSTASSSTSSASSSTAATTSSTTSSSGGTGGTTVPKTGSGPLPFVGGILLIAAGAWGLTRRRPRPDQQ